MSNTLDIVPELRDLIAAAEFMSKELVRVSKQRDELLKACKAVIQAREDGTFGLDGYFGLEMARAAIANAEGK